MKSVTSVPESSFQGIGRDMAERLGLGPEIRELKLGPTFTNNRSTAFHTLKYDFKPASVDVSKVAKVDCGANNTMTVTVPHLDGAGIPHTVFKGSQRPYHKECVLIIDRSTGEITLEKLTANIQVKKTRSEPKSQSHLAPSGASNSNNRPITPVETKRSPTLGRATGRTKVTSGKKREPSVQLHPKQYSPLRVSPYHGKSPPSATTNSSPVQPSSVPSTLASLPMIGSDNDDCPLPSSGSFATTDITAPSRSPPVVSTQPTTTKPTVATDSDEGALSDSSSSSSSSDSSDSDSDMENVPVLGTNGHLNSGTASPTLPMPNNLLNDDLQLSESESDSD